MAQQQAYRMQNMETYGSQRDFSGSDQTPGVTVYYNSAPPEQRSRPMRPYNMNDAFYSSQNQRMLEEASQIPQQATQQATQQQEKKSREVATAPVVFFLIFFILSLVGALVFWFLSNNSFNDPVMSPLEPTIICKDGKERHRVLIGDDNFETVNHCLYNAPSTSFTYSLRVCAEGGDYPEIDDWRSKLTDDMILDFAEFYVSDYIQTCGENWKDGNLSRDIVACAEKRGLTSPALTQIKQTYS